jgi:mono/diheme cytochrome c family protein
VSAAALPGPPGGAPAPASGAGPAGDGALRRARTRGRLTLAFSIVAGLVVFGWIANWGGSQTAVWEGAAFLDGIAPRQQDAASLPLRARESLVLRSDNRGQVLFGRYCDSCHPAGNEGLGASLRSAQFKRTFTTQERIVAYVRRGGFDMPAYPPDFLPDADLADIAAYVLSLPEAKR